MSIEKLQEGVLTHFSTLRSYNRAIASLYCSARVYGIMMEVGVKERLTWQKKGQWVYSKHC